MRAFSEYNPVVLFIYFFSVAGIAMFCMNPVILVLSLFNALLLWFTHNGNRDITSHFFFLIIYFFMAIINPLFSHNGVTVLFVVNDNPITLEATFYGVAASTMIISVIYWFRSFSQVMTSDKLLYLFSSVSPKLALVFSMSLRYVPLLSIQAKKVNQTQKALGLYKEDNAIDSIRGGIYVFSIMVTWALENGIITANSMSARGYSIGKRRSFSLFHFRGSDAVLLLLILILFIIALGGMMVHVIDFDYYPAIGNISISPLSLTVYISYAILAFMPSAIEIKENIKWKYLRSKI